MGSAGVVCHSPPPARSKFLLRRRPSPVDPSRSTAAAATTKAPTAELVLKVRAEFPTTATANSVVFNVPLPKSVTRASFAADPGSSGQSMDFKEATKMLEWHVKKIPGGSEIMLRAKLTLSQERHGTGMWILWRQKRQDHTLVVFDDDTVEKWPLEAEGVTSSSDSGKGEVTVAKVNKGGPRPPTMKKKKPRSFPEHLGIAAGKPLEKIYEVDKIVEHGYVSTGGRGRPQKQFKVLLTDYLRCLPSEVRTKLVDEAYVEQHNFASFNKKALDIEAKLGSAHQSQGDGRKKRLPQDWKKKGQLMFVDHDGQATKIDDFPDLGDETEQDGASETSDGGVVAPIKEKARGTGENKVVRSMGQGDQGTPAWVKLGGLEYEVWRDRVARGMWMNCGNYGHTSRTCRELPALPLEELALVPALVTVPLALVTVPLALVMRIQEDIHNLDDAVQAHNHAFDQVNSRLQQLGQRPVAAPDASSSNTSDRLNALEIDVGTLEDDAQLQQIATQQLEQRICAAAATPSLAPRETTPKFDVQDIFCDSTKTDPIPWFLKFELKLQLHHVSEDKHHAYLYSRSGGACQAWLDNLLSKYGLVAADLYTKISWDDLKAPWHKRFQVEPSEIKAMDKLMTFEQGTLPSVDWIVEYQRLTYVPDLQMGFKAVKHYISRSCPALGNALIHIEGTLMTTGELFEKASQIIVTNKEAKNLNRSSAAGLSRDYALLDSGATRNFMSQAFMQRDDLGAQVRRKANPTAIKLVDGRTQQLIDRYIEAIPVYFAPHACEPVRFDILDTDFDIILGMPWLASADQTVNFHRRTLTVRDAFGAEVSCTIPLPHPSIRCQVVTTKSFRATCAYEQRGEIGLCFLRAVVVADSSPMDLSSDPCVVRLLDEFTDIFKSPADVVPDRPISHEIILEAGVVLPKGCIYRMSEEELTVLRAQLDDLLDKGWIHPSSSPCGAPVLFVRKKNKDLRLCIDYCKLNMQTVKNAGPLPLTANCNATVGATDLYGRQTLELGTARDNSKVRWAGDLLRLDEDGPDSMVRKFELTLQLHYVSEHKHHAYLYSRSGGACQAWLDNLLSKYGAVAADLHTKISWGDLKAAWHKRFQVEPPEMKAMDKLMVFEQGTVSSVDWTAEYQRLTSVPDIQMGFKAIKHYISRSCPVLGNALSHVEDALTTLAELFDKVEQIIVTNKDTKNLQRSSAPGLSRDQHRPKVAVVAAATPNDQTSEAVSANERDRLAAAREGGRPGRGQGRGKAKTDTASSLGPGATAPAPWSHYGLSEQAYKAYTRFRYCLWCNNDLHDIMACQSKGKRKLGNWAPPGVTRQHSRRLRNRALLDSGASRNFMSQAFMQKAGLGAQVRRKANPTAIKLAGGRTQQLIDRYIEAVAVYFAPHACELMTFDILDTDFDIILGMPWLASADQTVNFHRRTLIVRDAFGAEVSCTIPLLHPSIWCQVVTAKSFRATCAYEQPDEIGLSFLRTVAVVDSSPTDLSSDPCVVRLLDEFADIFESPTEVVPDRPISHEIILEAGAVPPKGCIYRMSKEELTVLRAQLDDLLDKGWIRPSSSPYGVPALFVQKKNKDLRLCIDYRKLNSQTVKSAGPLPCIDDLLERLGSANLLDLRDRRRHAGQFHPRLPSRPRVSRQVQLSGPDAEQHIRDNFDLQWVEDRLKKSITVVEIVAAGTDASKLIAQGRQALDQFALKQLEEIMEATRKGEVKSEVSEESIDSNIQQLRNALAAEERKKEEVSRIREQEQRRGQRVKEIRLVIGIEVGEQTDMSQTLAHIMTYLTFLEEKIDRQQNQLDEITVGLRTIANIVKANLRKEAGPVSMTFNIPMYTASRLQVRYLQIVKQSRTYNPYRWVRYVTHASSYVIRL
ncbi:hypothetical protein CBR_g17619 [Chara braunii]|uniref:MHD domain-containing protein n=1 Tax=Chara braunii TaxID=69332 RepID=A0A388KV10_CHABU|nr:hypothetical protein CBR_g17619 [Chara braunii]|eukprot:GBG73905.1 hypothetical protein CBR_g17619 [Chara braunii]